MARRRRNEPVWPIFILLAFVAAGLGLGNLMTGDRQVSEQATSPQTSVPPQPVLPTPEDRIRVEVLNGAGVPGIAARATEHLRDRGFDVVYFGNESAFGRSTSLVVDRTARSGALDSVSRALRIDAKEVDRDSTRLVDVTVLLGSDWTPESASDLEPAEQARAGETASMDRPWWDLRRWLEEAR